MDQPGTKVVARGKVCKKYVDGGHHMVDCEIWLENAKGEKTTPGTATVVLPSRTAALRLRGNPHADPASVRATTMNGRALTTAASIPTTRKSSCACSPRTRWPRS